MKKILFIYGYGGSPESTFCTLIREALRSLPTSPLNRGGENDEYEVLCPEYPQEDCAKAHEFLLKYIKENDIDLIIGTSLGGFIALTLDTRVSTIVLNPCMVPSVELSTLKPRPGHPDDKVPSAEMIATYKPFEPDAFNKEAYKRRWIMGMFATNDELMGTKYKERFIDCYDLARSMPGGHHGNPEAIPYIVDAIKTCFAPVPEITDLCQFMCDLKKMHPAYGNMNFDAEKWLWLWRALRKAQDGEVVIRLIEGGNRIMKVGDSKCGYTPGLVEGAPIVIKYPYGSYQGGIIRSIDRKNETFKTDQSTYSYHFVRK